MYNVIPIVEMAYKATGYRMNKDMNDIRPGNSSWLVSREMHPPAIPKEKMARETGRMNT